MNLVDSFSNYLNSRYNHLSKKTVKNYRADVGMFVRWYEIKFGGTLNLNPFWVNIETLDLYKKERILESNLSLQSFKRHLSSLRKFFEFLKSEAIISQDPFELKNLLDSPSNQDDKWYLRRFRNYLYLNNKSNLTIKNYIFDIKRFLTWAKQVAGDDIFSKIDETFLNQYKKILVEKGLSARTIKRNFSSLQKYLSWINTEVPTESSKFDPSTSLRARVQSSKFEKDITIESASKFTQGQPIATEKTSTTYSLFPPLRLIQKIIRGASFILEITTIAPIVKTTEALNYSIHKIKGKPMFKKMPHIELGIQNLLAPRISNISPDHLPWHKKILHHIRHKRPKWYQIYHSYPIADYFHLSLLIVSMSILGFAIYQNISAHREKSVLSSFTAYSPHILSFRGQLTDDSNNPITAANTPLRIAIYNDAIATHAALLWEETINVNPDPNGMFSAFIGSNNPIPPSIFSEGKPLWLGVTISDSPELTPRQQLGNVAKALDSERLQGLVPITSPDADTKNVVLALDSSGNLTIGGNANPTFQATGGRFKLLGETLTLSTTPGTDSNVEIAPMDLGKIDLQKPILNSTENNNMDQALGAVEIDDSLGVLATTSAQSAFTINQTSTGQLISAYTNSIAKFTIDNNGNIISASGVKWQPFSDSTSALNIANAAGSTFLSFDTVNSTLRFLQESKERGKLFYQNFDSTFHIRSASALSLDTDNSSTPKVYIATSGNVGIGTTSPLFRLEVQDSQPASAAAQIFNTNTGIDADGLIVKLGNPSTTSVNSSNRFMSFETSGIGIVGSVRGDNATGVEFKTEGIADFAEYLKKDKTQAIEYGSVICIDKKGLVLPCDKTYNKMVGVSSNQGGFTGGKDQGEESIRVGFVGQVYTRVSTANGTINPGDPLASSSIPGVAVKAVSPGQIVGKALESLDDAKILGYYDIEKKEYIDKSALAPNILISQYPNLIPFGKILVGISVSWYDPDAHLASASEEKDLKDQILGVIQDYIQSSKIISPIAKSNQIDSDIISPLASDSVRHSGLTGYRLVPVLSRISNDDGDSGGANASQNDILGPLNASDSAALEPDLSEPKTSTLAAQYQKTQNPAERGQNTQNASASASQISSENQNSDFSDSLTSPTGSGSLSFPSIPKQPEASPIFPQGLMAFGPTSLTDASIIGQLSIGSIGGRFIITQNSINVIGADLELQPLRQGGLSIMGDLVYIDTDGNLKVEGNAEFAKDVGIKGNLVASGSATFGKLNLNLIQPALAQSLTNVIATGSAGTAFVHAYEIEVTIKNTLVTDKSLVYVTPAGTPSGQIPYLIRQMPEKPVLPAQRLGLRSHFGEGGSLGEVESEHEGSFTVGIASPSANRTLFNWLIIN